MNQNKYFNPGRFARLFKHDLLINQKIYFFAIAGIGIAIYLLSYFIMLQNRGGFLTTDSYVPLMLFYMMGLGALIGNSFPALKNQIKTSSYLLYPGSTFEKFMVQFVIRIVLLIPIAFGLFWIGTHLAKATMFLVHQPGTDPNNIIDFNYSYLLEDVPTLLDKTFVVFSIFSFATVLFAGAVWFKRFSLVKTLIITGLMFGVYLLTFVFFSHIFFSDKVVGFDIYINQYKVAKDLHNIQVLLYSVGVLSWLFLLPLAYFKLKEKEV
ncbi:hypothetical protein ACUNWD_16335 [Sunxiuqinia sp. A32]|uniref:hypothetical protein n=1 Tax=Sunxiuqinia sp. A32 TaxID=3461496 RepID=UPI0040451CD6